MSAEINGDEIGISPLFTFAIAHLRVCLDKVSSESTMRTPNQKERNQNKYFWNKISLCSSLSLSSSPSLSLFLSLSADFIALWLQLYNLMLYSLEYMYITGTLLDIYMSCCVELSHWAMGLLFVGQHILFGSLGSGFFLILFATAVFMYIKR